MKRIASVIFLLVTFFASSAKADIRIIYVNGAFNYSVSTAQQAFTRFEGVLRENYVYSPPYPQTKVTSELHYITASNYLPGAELAYQQSNAGLAIQISDSQPITYERALAQVYEDEIGTAYYTDSVKLRIISQTERLVVKLKSSIDAGDRVVLVAHSQGNLFAEAAIALLLKRYTGYDSKIAFVSIGSPAASSRNGLFLNISQDTVVYTKGGFGAWRLYENTRFSLLVANTVACVNPCTDAISADTKFISQKTGDDGKLLFATTGENHGAVKTYLNASLIDKSTKIALPVLVADKIKQAINLVNRVSPYTVTPNTAEISKDTVFTVTGQNLTTGMGFAVGDCTPSSNELPGGTDTKRQYRCTINGVPGEKVGVLKAKLGDTLSLYDFKVNAIITPSSKWISTITPPGYVVKQIINTDMATWPSDGRIGKVTGEYRINFDSIGCNLTQTTEISATRTGASFDLSVKYVSPQTTCTDGSHTAIPEYTETFTGILNQGVLFVTPKTACSFRLDKCYNFESFAPIP